MGFLSRFGEIEEYGHWDFLSEFPTLEVRFYQLKAGTQNPEPVFQDAALH
jgi:hypothetical protein